MQWLQYARAAKNIDWEMYFSPRTAARLTMLQRFPRTWYGLAMIGSAAAWASDHAPFHVLPHDPWYVAIARVGSFVVVAGAIVTLGVFVASDLQYRRRLAK